MRDLKSSVTNSDVNRENWAIREHPRKLYLGLDVHGNEKMHRGRLVNPAKSMHAGGTVVKGRSKKAKFLAKCFVHTHDESDRRTEAMERGQFVQSEPVIFAPRHSGTPVKTVKHVRLSNRVR